MIPHEKQMVERLKDRPFALIGVNSDGGRSALQKIIKDNGITWRNFVDGDTSGPIASKWGVAGWPTIYVLDAKGVIRYKNPSDEKKLDEAVNTLLAEAR
jgi:hypothetical protein